MKRKRARDVKLHHVLNMSSGFRFYQEHPLNIILSDSIYVYYSEGNRVDTALSITKRK
jgi:CubicO group peptidase (beta-lactamase class C family)